MNVFIGVKHLSMNILHAYVSVFSWRQFTLLNWPDSDSDFAQVRVRVSVRVPDPTQSQSQVSLKKAGSGKHWYVYAYTVIYNTVDSRYRPTWI